MQEDFTDSFSISLLSGDRVKFGVVIEKDEDGYYVASVPELPGCHTQAKTLDEVKERIEEAIQVYLDADETKDHELKPEFIKEIEETCKHGKFIKVKNFAEEYGLK